MNRRQKIIISVTGIFIVLLLLVGLTYGYFLTKISGNNNEKSISVTTADLKLVYNDGSDGVIGGELLIPSDTEYTKTFTVTNEGNADIDYAVYLIDVVNTFVRKDDIKYTLSCTTNGTIACNGVTSETTFPSGINQLVTNTIEEGKTHTYTFKFTYKDTGTDQSIDMNKELSAKIQIYGKNGNNEYFPYENGTLTATILSNVMNNNSSTKYSETPKSSIGKTYMYTTGEYEYTTMTADVDATYPNYEFWGLCSDSMCNSYSSVDSFDETVGHYIYNKVSLKTIGYVEEYDKTNKIVKIRKDIYASEKTLSKTQDNEGTTYYFKGVVEDNYVNFAGMCWRIVRIDGAGNTKLVLEDKNTTCDNTSYTGNFVYGTGYMSTITISEGNSQTWTYNDYEDSNVATVLKKFQNEKLSSYTNYLANANWCVGAKAYLKDGDIYKLMTEEEKVQIFKNKLVSGSTEYQNVYYDVYNSNTSLICGSDNLISTYSDGTEVYASLLTPAEYNYSGGGENMYLINSYAKKGNYMGVTILFNGVKGEIYASIGNIFGYIPDETMPKGVIYANDFAANGYTGIIRPTIKLKSSVLYKSGDGTIENPYIVE